MNIQFKTHAKVINLIGNFLKFVWKILNQISKHNSVNNENCKQTNLSKFKKCEKNKNNLLF